MSYRVFVGVDPGLTGAVAWVGVPEHGDGPPVLLDVRDMPTVRVRVGKGHRNKLNLPALADAVSHPAISHPEMCFIEEVHSMPGQGVASTFTFGHAFGAIEGIMAGAGVPYRLIPPKEWQAPYKIRGQEKDKSRLVAAQLFPGRSEMFKRKMDNGRSDAALLALHAAVVTTQMLK